MKSKSRFLHTAQSLILSVSFGIAAPTLVSTSQAAQLTWDGAPDGGGSSADGNWSTGSNWVGDAAPAATGDTLVFGGTTNLNAANDIVTSLTSNSISFAAGAGSFNLSGNAIILGNSASSDAIITQASANNQTISLPLTLAGGGRDRQIIMSGAGSLTLSGNFNFSNDWLFPTTTAGTIILSGNNSGDGKGSAVIAGANAMRAMMRNNVAGTQLVLGSDTALGNSGSGDAVAGTANFKGLIANQSMSLSTTGGNRNLSGSSLAINAGNITFNGTDNLTVANIITVSGNRDFNVSNTGSVTVSNGLFLSNDQTGRNLYVNLSGAGGMIVNGPVYDTFNPAGITTPTPGTLRKAGTATLTLNGDSSYTDLTTIEAGTLKIGHANALGATGTTAGTTLTGNATLDLNGFETGESLTFNNNGNKLINSSATAAVVSVDTTVNAPMTVDTTGDITATRLICNATRIITKLGVGTLTTNGTSHNNLSSWDIQVGTVVLANTSGYGADRAVTINGGTLKLSGANSDLINNAEAFTVNSGTFDLTGKSEATASIGGSGGTITNSVASTTSTLYVGGSTSGTSTASFAGTIQNGAGTLALAKEGTGTQTLTGPLAYSGTTTVSNGTLSINSASLNNSAAVNIKTVGGTGILFLDYTGTDVVGDFQIDGVSQGTGTYDKISNPGLIDGDGKLEVLAASGYSTWASTNVGGQPPSEDYNNDGVSNGVAYFMNNTGAISLPGIVGGAVTWTNGGKIPSSAYGAANQFRVETSQNLTTWTEVTSVAIGTTPNVNSNTTLTYNLPTGQGKWFVRLVVTPN